MYVCTFEFSSLSIHKGKQIQDENITLIVAVVVKFCKHKYTRNQEDSLVHKT